MSELTGTTTPSKYDGNTMMNGVTVTPHRSNLLGNIASGLAGGIPGFLINGASSLLSFFANKHQWNQANEYNTPAAQMQRLKSAGLNPNLVYNGGSVAGLTTNTGQPQLATPHWDDGDAISTYSSNRLARQKLQYIDALISQAYANVGLANKKSDLTETQKAIADIVEKLNEKAFNYDLEARQQLGANILSNINRNNAATKLLSSQKELVDQRATYQGYLNQYGEQGITGSSIAADIARLGVGQVQNDGSLLNAFIRFLVNHFK